MKEVKFCKINEDGTLFKTVKGQHSFYFHDWAAIGTDYWIKNRSFDYAPNNGWHVYKEDTFIKKFKTLKQAKQYIIDSVNEKED